MNKIVTIEVFQFFLDNSTQLVRLAFSYGRIIGDKTEHLDLIFEWFAAFYVNCKVYANKTNTMDKEIADRMRSENAEQFQTLVRMHLSFELDLNTEPVE